MKKIMEASVTTSRGKVRTFPVFYSKGEEIFNAVSHIAGGAIGVAFLIIGVFFAYPSATAMAAMAVFGICITVLYTMSALYHFLRNNRAKAVFRIFDHCTIFLLIAGTYTPYCMIVLGGTAAGTWILASEWTLAVLGITGNAIAMKNIIIKSISMVFYFVMGWLILVAIVPLYSILSAASFYLLLAGGVSYTAGIVFYAFGKKIKYFHSVWHLFDIAGTVLQFISLLLYLI